MIAWHQKSNKEWSVPILTDFTDIYASPGLSVLGYVCWCYNWYMCFLVIHMPLTLTLCGLYGEVVSISSLTARFIGPTWGPSGADRTQVGPMLAPWTLLSGLVNFLPEASFGLRVLSLPASVCLCVCPSVCVSVNPELVRAINHHAFKLEPPNLDKRCKTTWLRSLLFWGAIDLDLQGQI